jgi:hypothetical protein
MKVSVSAIIEAVFSGLLLGSSAIMYFLGPSAFIILFYGLVPMDTREFLYNNYPPDTFFAPNTSLLLTGVMVLSGVFLAAGIWTSYPNMKPIVVITTVALWGWLLYFLMSPFPMAY